MKPRLQTKEFFFPLAGGVQTEADPHLPTSPTVVTNNADFSVRGVIKKREPLAVLYGNTSTDAPTALPSGISGAFPYMNNVVFFGNGTYHTTYAGKVSTTSNGKPYTSSVKTEIIPLSEWSAVNVSTRGPSITHSIGTNDGYFVDALRMGGAAEVVEETSKIVHSLDIVTDSDYFIGAYANGLAGGMRVLATSETETNIFVKAVSDNGTLSELCNFTAPSGFKSASYQFCHIAGESWAAIASNTGNNNYAIATGNSTALIANTVITLAGAATDVNHVDIGNFNSGELIVGAYSNVNVSVSIVNSTTLANIATCVVTTIHTTPLTVATGMYNATVALGAFSGNSATDATTKFYSYAYSAGGGTLTATAGPVLQSMALVSRFFSGSDGYIYVWVECMGGKWFVASPTGYDTYSPQNHLLLLRVYLSGTAMSLVPVSRIYEHQLPPLADSYRHVSVPKSMVASNGSTVYYTPIVLGGEYNPVENYYSGGTVQVALLTASFSDQRVRPVDFYGYTMIPGGYPLEYDGSMSLPMGVPTYPQGTTLTTTTGGSNFTAAGGNGTYNYITSYSYKDALGAEHESAPSPSVNVAVDSTNDKVNVSVFESQYGDMLLQDTAINIYRTSADGNDFFLAKVAADATAVTQDTGSYGFSTNSGLDRLYTAKALYTLNGSLENFSAFQHYAACTHKGRYLYATGSSDIYYSKSKINRIGPEFNEVLIATCDSIGGEIRAVVSAFEKVFIFKRGYVFVMYGDPLNDAGAGEGFSEPRLMSSSVGVSGQRCASVIADGLFFINDVDGLIYQINQAEQISYVGGAVRHYCELYAYNNVWHNARESCVKFSSSTVGAPTLSYNYKYGLWTLLTGRYALGTKCAFAAPVGTSYGFGTDIVDVVMDNSNYVYIQDPLGTFGTTESYNLNVATSWISLNDIGGYGKFYKWVLVGGKPSANCNVIVKTAYDYDPYWADTQEVNITTSVATYGLSSHYSMNLASSIADKGFKLDVDGSRHKTDAIKLFIGDNNNTERNNIEIVGVRLEVGVKPGRTKIGSDRSVS